MAGSYIVNVPKLKGRENYDEWAFAAENFLLLDGVDINEESAGDVASVDLKKAKAKLIMTIDSSLFVHIKNEKTVKEVWNRLKTLFDDSGFTRRIGLLRQLISIRLEDSDSMTAYVTQMVDTAQKLKGTGFEITDEWVGSLLLAGLSEKFAPMIMAIEHSGMKISTDAIKAKLLDMESSTVGSTDGAFLSKSWQQRNKKRDNNVNMSKSQTSNQKTTTKAVRCYRCKQPGHYMNKCPQNSREKTENAFSAIFLNPQNQFRVSDWYVDSGASSHMVVDKNCLEKVISSHEVKNIVVANRETIPVLCAGNTRITTVIDDSEFDIPVKNVLCIPNLTTNLLSVSQLIQNGNSVSFEEDVCYIRNRQNALVGKAELVNGVYRLCIKSPTLFVASAAVATSEMWHRRLGHINSQDLNTMKNGVVEGISYPDRAVIDKSKCITCCEGKQARLPFTHKGTRSEAVLELVHADVCGPMEQVSIGSSRYFLLFVDDFSRMAFVYFLKAKSEVYKYFKEFKAFVERQTGRKLKVLRTDNGGEFCSLEMKCFLQKAGIAHQKTNPYTPEQNGMCERMNRTVVERARCLLFDANMPKKFWAEAVNTAVYLRNRTIASGLTRTPYELWTGRKPDVSHVRVFGSTAMTHVPKMKTAKWDKKAEKLILVGYDNNVKGYRLFDPKSNKIITSRDVIIMEHAQSTNDMTQAVVEEKSDNFEGTEPTIDSSDLTCTSPEGDTTLDVTYVPDDTGSSSSADEFFNTLSDTNQLNIRNITSEKRQRRAPERFGFMCVGEENLTYADVMSGPEQKEWCSAMKDEMRSFSECDAWEIVEKPDNCTIVKCKWVYKKKLDSDNKVRYRARLVAKGFTQKEGIDFKETFSPVLSFPGASLIMIKGYKHLQDCAYIGDDSSEEINELIEANRLGLLSDDALNKKISELKVENGKVNNPETMKRHKSGVSFHDPKNHVDENVTSTSSENLATVDVTDHDPKELREILERLHALREAAKIQIAKNYRPPANIMSLPALHRHRDANVDKEERKWISFQDIDGNTSELLTKLGITTTETVPTEGKDETIKEATPIITTPTLLTKLVDNKEVKTTTEEVQKAEERNKIFTSQEERSKKDHSKHVKGDDNLVEVENEEDFTSVEVEDTAGDLKIVATDYTSESPTEVTEPNSKEVFEDVLHRLQALGDKGKRVLMRLHETMGVEYTEETPAKSKPDIMSVVTGSGEELDRLRRVLVEAIDEEKNRSQREQKRRDAAEQARKKRESMLGHIDLVKELNENDEERNHAGEIDADGYADHHQLVNETTPLDMSNSEFWSSFSSSEEALLECEGLILNLPLTPHRHCFRNASESEAFAAAKANALTYRVPANGYYFFVFNSENEVQRNYIRARFELQKTRYDVARTALRECTNSTQRCDLPLDIFSTQKVVLEVPLRNNDSLWNEQFLIISECEPRTSIYIFCVIAVPILILVFGFQ